MLANVSDEEMVTHFQSAKAFIFPGLDDFGITPIEAMAAGTPVIAYKAGGALDYVVPGKTGEFFDKQTPESLQQALQSFNAHKYASDDIKLAANEFSAENFQKNIHKLIAQVLQ